MKLSGDLSFNKDATITVYDTLVITGNLSLDKDANLTIGNNGVLIVLGDYSSDKSLSIANGGRIVVVGAVQMAKDATISNSGAIYFYDDNPQYDKGFSSSGTPIKNESDLQTNDPSLFAFVNGGSILLPIVLDYFKAEVSPSNSILVSWGTVTEKENDFFTLEKSLDGKTFETIATVTGAGNSQKKLSYSFEDKNALAGMNYYRLKQTDFNGDFEYFKIVGVNNPSASAAQNTSSEDIVIDKVWPNPFKETIHLDFTTEKAGDVEVLVQNSTGVIIHKEIVSVYEGENTYQFSNGSQLKPGVYFINLWSNGKKFKPQRIIKL